MSNAPVTVGGKTLGVEPRKAAMEVEKAESEDGKASDAAEDRLEQNQQKFAQIMHYSYGTAWGVARGVLDMASQTNSH